MHMVRVLVFGFCFEIYISKCSMFARLILVPINRFCSRSRFGGLLDFPMLQPNRQHWAAVSGQVSSRMQLSVLGNGANANPISITISTDKSTHLFNCGEGVQRLLFEHK